MDYEMFKRKVVTASYFLRTICPHDNPTEEQIAEAVKSVGIQIADESVSYTQDPVRLAVFTSAYRPSDVTRGFGIEKAMVFGFEWMKRHNSDKNPVMM